MSTITTHLPLDERSAPQPSRRLWNALAHPPQREQPPRGMDLLGEWATGAARRARVRRLDWRRASRILEAGRALAQVAEEALSLRAAEARDLAILSRDDPATIDAVFTLALAAIKREIGLFLHPEQILAALAMARGACAELATGEGKTVTAILPAALDAFSGRGVHVVTVNDYLAKRDAAITRPALSRIGLTVVHVDEKSTQAQRRLAYESSITYLADKQAIFDHLRDRLVSPIWPRVCGLLLDEIAGPRSSADPRREATSESYRGDWGALVVQRGLHAAIIDEADSVLIDDAVTPAVISGEVIGPDSDRSHFPIAASIAASLTAGEHYTVEPKVRRVTLTPPGRERLEAAAAQLASFWSGPRRREELIIQAISAKELYKLGDDYIIREGKVEIVDRSTGRVLPGRQWQLGVHQAVEAKEGVEVSSERLTTARCSYQEFFRRYRRLSGMTGTAREVAPELWRSYRLPVVSVPTHKPVARTRAPDRVFTDHAAKFEALAARIEELHASGRPVLIGTRSISASESLGQRLRERGIPCDILNAQREAEEAAIIARAGHAGAVTVATNMAGRGTDIQLDEQSRSLGGLAVIATERHDESRVDRQLFGRAGRQGDPGSAEMFVALDDHLIAQHGLRSLLWLLRLGGPASRPLRALLWRGSQWAASRKWRTLRAETERVEAWQDMALHRRTR